MMVRTDGTVCGNGCVQDPSVCLAEGNCHYTGSPLVPQVVEGAQTEFWRIRAVKLELVVRSSAELLAAAAIVAVGHDDIEFAASLMDGARSCVTAANMPMAKAAA